MESVVREPNMEHSCGGQFRRDYKAESSNVWTFTNALGDGKKEARVVDGGLEANSPVPAGKIAGYNLD